MSPFSVFSAAIAVDNQHSMKGIHSLIRSFFRSSVRPSVRPSVRSLAHHVMCFFCIGLWDQDLFCQDSVSGISVIGVDYLLLTIYFSTKSFLTNCIHVCQVYFSNFNDSIFTN